MTKLEHKNKIRRIYTIAEVSEKLNVTPKQVERLIVLGGLSVTDIRASPHVSYDYEFLRITGESLDEFKRKRYLFEEYST